MVNPRRSGVLEFAILGLLHDSPMHGYELRKRLNGVLGTFRAISYGSLYPALKDLLDRGYIAEAGPADASAPALTGRRAKIVYELTADGKDRFNDLVSRTGPEAWEDEAFGVHLAFFARTTSEVRMRILEGRRSRLEERLSNLHGSMARGRERIDNYTLELQRHGLEGVEREVRWLSELIANESELARTQATAGPTGATTAGIAGSNPNPTGNTGAGPRSPQTRG
jgi:DNA-binding PadR family transcriptional regulator